MSSEWCFVFAEYCSEKYFLTVCQSFAKSKEKGRKKMAQSIAGIFKGYSITYNLAADSIIKCYN